MQKKKTRFILFFIAILITVVLFWYDSSLGWLNFAVFAVLLLGLVFSVKQYSISLLFYLSIMMLYYVFAPIIQSFVGVRYASYTNIINHLTVSGFVFISLHVIGVLIGFIAVKPARKRISSYTQYSKKRLRYISIIIPLLFVVCAIYFLGPEKILLPRNEQGDAIVLNTFELFGYLIVKFITSFVILYWLQNGGIRQNGWYLSPVFLMLLLFQIIVSNPVNTGRFVSLSGVLIVVGFVLVNSNRKGLMMWWFAATPIVALLLLPLTSLLRSGMTGISIESIFQAFSSLEFSAYTVLVDGMEVKDFPSDNYTLSHLFIFIPRLIWDSKADAIGAFIADNSGYVYHNVGVISFYNPYVDYGYTGLFVASILFGILLRKADVFRITPDFRNRKFMYSLCLLVSIPMIFRGDLSTAMIGLYASILAYEISRFFTAMNIRYGQ